MTPQEFYDHAKKFNACPKGLYWLKSWMRKNPKKSLTEFFKSKMNTHGEITDGYLVWCALVFIDWKFFNHRFSHRMDFVNWMTNGRSDSPMHFTRKEACEYLIFFFCEDVNDETH